MSRLHKQLIHQAVDKSAILMDQVINDGTTSPVKVGQTVDTPAE